MITGFDFFTIRGIRNTAATEIPISARNKTPKMPTTHGQVFLLLLSTGVVYEGG